MGIFDRMNLLLRANINDLLNRAEDPAKMLDQILRDMEAALIDVRAQVAELVAQQRAIEADLQRATSMRDESDAKARAAVGAGKDDLARQALRSKAQYQKSVDAYTEQLKTQQELVDRLKSDLAELERKHDEASRRRDELIARARRAQAQQKAAEAGQRIDSYDPTSPLSQLESQVRSQEAKAEAMEEVQKSSLEAQFEELEANADVEGQLAQMKEEAKGAPKPKASDDKKGFDAYPQ